MTAITAQARRVNEHTSARSQAAIDGVLEASLLHHARHPEAIDQRLEGLRQEWDIERTLECNAATISFLSILHSALTGRKTYLLAGVVTGFLFQHAVQGWCPPLPIFRRLGIRTKDEINQEYICLQLLRHGLDEFRSLRDADPVTRVAAILAVVDDENP